MTQFQAKLKLIIIPFLVIAFSTICIYTFLHWLLVVWLKLFVFNKALFESVIPMLIPWIPLLIWLRPRLKMLALKKTRNDDPLFQILFLAWATIAAGACIAQPLMVTATGRLTRLHKMSEIKHLPPTKYYQLDTYYCSKKLAHVRPYFRIVGKNRSDLEMHIYVAVPVFDMLFPDTTIITKLINGLHKDGLVILNGKRSTLQVLKALPTDSIKMMRYVNPTMVMPSYGEAGRYGALAVVTRSYRINVPGPPKLDPAGWLAIEYRKTISNSLSKKDKDTLYKQFARASQVEFLKKKIERFSYLDRLPIEEELIYKEAINEWKDVVPGEPLILRPVYEPFSKRNGIKPFWLAGVLFAGSSLFLLVISLATLKAQYYHRPRVKRKTKIAVKLDE